MNEKGIENAQKGIDDLTKYITQVKKFLVYATIPLAFVTASFGFLGGVIYNQYRNSSPLEDLNAFATKNFVVNDMGSGIRSFNFEDEDVLLYNPVDNSFTRTTLDDLNFNKYREIDGSKERVWDLGRDKKYFTEFEAKVDSLYNSLRK